jgi:protein-S-isoprenylcysteine O-methyltransferase Ste14
MYSGGLVMLCGWPVILSNVLTVLFLPVYFLYISRFQVEPEERALASLFGTMCVAYQGRAGRWL